MPKPTTKQTAAKNTAEKPTTKKRSAREVLVQVHTRGDSELTESVRERLDALAERDEQKNRRLRSWLEDLMSMSRKLKAAKAAYRQSLRETLDGIYAKYIEIEFSDIRNDFYHELRVRLLDAGYRVQINTPDAGLLIRLVWGNSELSNSRIQQYAAVLVNARNNDVAAGELVDWLKETRTLSEAAKQIRSNYEDIRKERLKRARIFIIKYLEWSETRPYAKLKMYAENANNYVNVNTHLIVMLGTAIRRFDRESDYADIHISHIMPPNLDIEIKIIDKWARHIEPKLEIYEAKAEQISIEQWALQLEDELWAFDVAEAEKQTTNWQLRQQAGRYEDQQEFAQYAKAFKKEKLKASKAAKSTKVVKSVKPRKALKKKP